MLVRAAARRQRRYISRQLSEDFQQLQLPFLCPAQVRWNATQVFTPPVAIRRQRASSPSPKSDRQQSRNLASVAGDPDRLPLAHPSDSSTTHPSTYKQPNFRWDYNEGTRPLILNYERENVVAPAKFQDGIGGTSAELMQNLYTCLRVQRWTRAEQILQRLAALPETSQEKLAHAHEVYLNTRVDEIHGVPGLGQNWKYISDFFELEILGKNILVGESAYITMIRGAIAALASDTRDAVVIRYADLSQVPYLELCDNETWSDREFLMVGAILGEHTPQEREALEKEANELPEETLETNEPVTEGDLPEILEVEQKGLGVQSLKDSLKAMSTSLPLEDPEDSLDPDAALRRAMARERLIEDSAAEAAVARWKAEEENLRSLGLGGALNSKPLGALMWSWYSALLPVLNQELIETRRVLAGEEITVEDDERLALGTYLESVPAETLAASTIFFVMGMLSRGKDRDTDKYSSNLKLTNAAHNLGKLIQEESAAALKRQQHRRQSRGRLAKNIAAVRKTIPKKTSTIEAKDVDWSLSIRVKVGALLISKLIDTAKMPATREHPRTKEKVTQLQPVFVHKNIYKLGRRQGYLTATSDLLEKLHREPLGGAIAKKLPMVVEPVPWTGFKEGGYLNYTTDFIRFPPTDQTPRDYAMAAIDKGDLSQVMGAINALSSIAWKVNQDILKVQIEAWNSGEAIGKFAPLDPKFDVPPEPSRTSDPNTRRQWLSDIREIENKKIGYHSQRCFQNFQLEIARSYRNEVFYFPHNIDFRGRAYPVPPYLNHMGADNARGVLTFAKGKELGSTGLRWLKIHLANVFGYDKASLQEREEFVMEHISEVYDSAQNPLTGGRWWLKSEDAWQTLAACIELRNALESSDPTKYVSTLPIHQDGTCNGLQHYAALGGDEIGARQVNLVPGDRPADVYTAVCDAVKAGIEKDFNNDHPVAKLLHGKITRKVVKQPVMTNVYGVTYYGAKEQVKKQIEEIFPNLHRSEIINTTTLSAYVARKIFKSLGEMFTGAQAIQEWLGTCADRISSCVTPEQMESLVQNKKIAKRPNAKEKLQRTVAAASKELFKSSVIWTTPLKLPVVQPYRIPKTQIVGTVMQSLSLQEPRLWDPVSKRKQLQGFPPNFIHSLDATHMMLSAIKSQEKDITFASIHDSFWTHACDIDDLSELLRDAFVHMHSEDIVGRLRQEMQVRYKGAFYLASIDGDSAVAKKLKKAQAEIAAARKKYTHLFGDHKYNTVQADLLMERERLRLINSEDAEEREKGEAMITSASIFAEEADESVITVPSEIAEARLGEMPEDDVLAQEQDNSNGDLAEAALKKSEDMDVEDEVENEVKSGPEDANLSEYDRRVRFMQTVGLDNEIAGFNNAKSKQPAKRAYVWLPLKFPDVPEKGSFDVRTLKQSRYFFH